MPGADRVSGSSDFIIDVTVGMSDGLIIPFALTTGWSVVAASAPQVFFIGLCAAVLGALAMGAARYAESKTGSQGHHGHEHSGYPGPERSLQETEMMEKMGLNSETIEAIRQEQAREQEEWLNAAGTYGLPEEKEGAPGRSAGNIALAYLAGGVLPALPYIVTSHTGTARWASCSIALSLLFILGGSKAKFTGRPVIAGGLRQVMTGGVAAAAAGFIASLFV